MTLSPTRILSTLGAALTGAALVGGLLTPAATASPAPLDAEHTITGTHPAPLDAAYAVAGTGLPAQDTAAQAPAPQWIGDPWPDTPGFPLPYTPPDGADTLDFGIRDTTPAPFTLLNYGGIPLKSPNFVNIGDSYTTTTFYGTTLVEPCFRNAVGFAPAVAAQVKLPPRDAACPGAGIEHYWHTMKSFQFPVPKMPQRLAINKDTQLVVVSLGGNDAYTESMVSLALKCVASWTSPVERLSSNPCERRVGTRLFSRAKAMERALTYVLKDAKKRASKDAVVIAMGYFNPFPSAAGYCWERALAPVGDLKFVHNLFVTLNESVRQAAKNANVLYHNPSAEEAFARSSCGLPLYRLISITGLPEFGVPFHPTLTGHWNMSKHVASLYEQEMQARRHGRSITRQTWRVGPGSKDAILL